MLAATAVTASRYPPTVETGGGVRGAVTPDRGNPATAGTERVYKRGEKYYATIHNLE